MTIGAISSGLGLTTFLLSTILGRRYCRAECGASYIKKKEVV